jgi:hypothetical protein
MRQKGKDIEVDEKYSDYPSLSDSLSALFKIFPPFNF